ncbi:MAG: tRNA modification GTPase MnmE [Candidatus Sericytochromatia bacterium]|nr:MAG: tRNA modification GTPase MnmE [Candidatus Sericytochromatia bacterium]
MIYDDTIVAISTPPGIGGIGIVRMSGSKSLEIARKFFNFKKKEIESHRAYFGKIIDNNIIIDSALLIYFKKPKSFTGEDTIEIHCHGNNYILNKVLELCIKYGARLSRNGEFTQRAFLNGKIDLTQAEAVYDIINSKTSLSLQNANNILEGKLSTKINQLRSELIKILSHIEAIIDFPDEIDEEPLSTFVPKIKSIYNEIQKLIETSERGQIYREGIKIAIIGKPNVGKSSLLNALLRLERAIVTDIPGTTRDTLEEYINIKGIPINIIDTAGIRHTDDKVEKIGIEKSKDSINKSQLVLFIVSAENKKLDDEEISIINEIKSRNKDFILIVNKIDLFDNFNIPNFIDNIVFISAKYKRGIEDLEEKIFETILKNKTDTSLDININNRHKEILLKAKESLEKSIKTIESNLPIDFLTIDIKSAIVNMGEITGENVTEEIITEIFSNFCVGK